MDEVRQGVLKQRVAAVVDSQRMHAKMVCWHLLMLLVALGRQQWMKQPLTAEAEEAVDAVCSS